MLAWNTITGATKAEILEKIDGLISFNGIRYGYIDAAYATSLDLPLTVSHFLTVMANSTNYRMIQAIPVYGTGIYLLEKRGGTWGSAWKSIVAT